MPFPGKHFGRARSMEGATAVEYGIMVALIAAVIVSVVLVLGRQVNQGFCQTSEGMDPAFGSGASSAEGC